MNEELKQLVEADSHDRDAFQIKSDALKAKRDVQDTKDELARLAKAISDLQQQIEANKAAQAATRRTISEYQNHRKAAVRMLETGSGDPDAAQRQFDATGQRIDDEETRQLEQMEALDDMQDKLAVLVEQQATCQSKLTELDALLEPLLVEKRKTYAQAMERRDTALADIQPNLKSKYLSFRAKNKWAVSFIVKEGCSECGRVIHPQHLQDIRRGVIRPCTGCFRWIVPLDEQAK